MADEKRVMAVTVTVYPEQLEILDTYAKLVGGNRSSALRSIVMQWERLAGENDKPVWLERKA